MRKVTPERRLWWIIKTRCFNQNAKDWRYYGGAGITICPQWAESFQRFLSDVGPRPSRKHWLTRINVGMGYFPGNVEWALPSVQRRRMRNVSWINVTGKLLPMKDASNLAGLGETCLYKRVEKQVPPRFLLAPMDLRTREARALR